MKKLCFGIDLGTTNSAIAVLRGKDNVVSQIITLKNGAHTLPSCVQYSHGNVIVGSSAYNHRWLTEQVVYSVKRYMGTDKVFHINDGDTEFDVTPEQVSSEILKKLVSDAELQYGAGTIKELTITVPAYFNNNQRRATIKAAELAGLKVLKIINEPTSAALAYGLDDVKDDERVLIYDLGGGTFDVTLLEIHQNESESFELLGLEDNVDQGKTITVISNGGDTHLGGDDFDRSVYKIAMDRLEEMTRKEKPGFKTFEVSRDMEEQIILQIETWKKFNITNMLIIPIKAKLDGVENDLQMYLYKEDAAYAFEGIYARCSKCVQECLSTAPKQDFSKIVLVGGSTKLKLIRDRLHEEFPHAEIYDRLNPDESVARGAAVQTGLLYGGKDLAVFDVIPLPLGIGVEQEIGDALLPDRFEIIIKKDALLPVSNSKSVSTIVDNQAAIDLPVYQGLSKTASENAHIGTVHVRDIPKKPAGEVSVVVTMSVDMNGILTVSANCEGKITDATLENILKSGAVEPVKQLSFAMKKLKKAVDIAKRQRVDIAPLLQKQIDDAFASDKLTPGLNKWIADMQHLGTDKVLTDFAAEKKLMDEEIREDAEFDRSSYEDETAKF